MAAFVNFDTHGIIDYSFIPSTDYSTMKYLSHSHPRYADIGVPQSSVESPTGLEGRACKEQDRRRVLVCFGFTAFSIYECSCELMYCNSLYDVYFEGYDKTYHLAFTTNDSEKQCHIKIFFQPFSRQKAIC